MFAMDTDHKPVILIVDDEPNILQGLRRATRGQRNIWSMEFAEGGRQALERLEKGAIDVLVCDMRMPDVDGAKVLAATAKAYPESIRIILSGFAEKDAMLDGLASAHQLLPKPCDSETLIKVIEESLALRDLLPIHALRQLVGKLAILPIPSERYFQLIRELDHPIASAKSVGSVLDIDLGLATLVLRLVNSAFFAIPYRVIKCRDAVELLGFETIRALATLSEFYLWADMDPALVEESQALAQRSLKIASMARQIAERMGCSSEVVEDAATAGLLCHIGTVVLWLNRQVDFKQIQIRTEKRQKSINDIETEVFGAGHAVLGAYLIGLWGFSNSVVEAVAFHHNPTAARRHEKGCLAAVHLAQALACSGDAIESDAVVEDDLAQNDTRMPGLDKAYLEEIGFHELSLVELVNEINIVRTSSD